MRATVPDRACSSFSGTAVTAIVHQREHAQLFLVSVDPEVDQALVLWHLRPRAGGAAAVRAGGAASRQLGAGKQVHAGTLQYTNLFIFGHKSQ